MNDVWLPRIIVIGLLVVACFTIAASYMEPSATWCSYIVTSIVSGLLGYVTSPLTAKDK